MMCYKSRVVIEDLNMKKIKNQRQCGVGKYFKNFYTFKYMVTYIATIGETIEAIINTFWEFLLKCQLESNYRKYIPNKFVALASKTDNVKGIKGTEEKISIVKQKVLEVCRKVLGDEYEIDFRDKSISQENPKSIIDEILKLHDELKDNVHIADVTGGRKTMSIGATLGAIKLVKLGVEVKVLYFWLFNPRNIGKILSELASGKDYELIELDIGKLL